MDNAINLNRVATICNYIKNYGSVPMLTNARAIDGVLFDGKSAITHYGECTTGASLSAKLVSCTGFTLVTGARISVKFTNTNSANTITLNVNNTGAKDVYFPDPTNPTTLTNNTTKESGNTFRANIIYDFIYNGTRFELVKNTFVSAVSSADKSSSADKLATARTIAISGGATGTATSFDGTANITIPVTSLDASKLKGTGPINITGTSEAAKTIKRTDIIGSTDSPVDLNTVLTPGKYYVKNKGYTNSPFGDSTNAVGGANRPAGLLYVINSEEKFGSNIENTGYQIFISRSSIAKTNVIAIRTYNKEAYDSANAGFTPWKILMTNGEYQYSKQSASAINLNNVYLPGIYYFENNSNYEVANLPGSSVNGWLIVMTNQTRSSVRQLFFRRGTIGAWSGNAAYSRIAGANSDGTTWSDWVPIYIGNGTVRWGTANPSGGDVDGSIYLKYS